MTDILNKENEVRLNEKINEHILADRIGYIVNATALYFKLSALKVFKEHGFDITPEQCAILFVLANNDGLYQRQISQILLKDRPNTSRLVDILEKKGFTLRKSDPTNRRIVKVYITDKGREQMEKAFFYMRNLTLKAIDGVSDTELEITKKVMNKIMINLEDEVNIQM